MRLASPEQTLEMLFFSLFGLVGRKRLLNNAFLQIGRTRQHASAAFGARLRKNHLKIAIRHLHDGMKKLCLVYFYLDKILGHFNCAHQSTDCYDV